MSKEEIIWYLKDAWEFIKKWAIKHERIIKDILSLVIVVFFILFLIFLFVWRNILNNTVTTYVPYKVGTYTVNGTNNKLKLDVLRIDHLIFIKNKYSTKYPKHGEFIIIHYRLSNNSINVLPYDSKEPVIVNNKTYPPFLYTNNAYVQAKSSIDDIVEYDMTPRIKGGMIEIKYKKTFFLSGTVYNISI